MFLVRAFVYLAACAYLLVVLPPTGEAFAAAAGDLVAGAWSGRMAERAFLLGAAVFVPLAWLLRRALRFWYALAHELTHGVAAIFMGAHPDQMQVSASGEGKVTFARAPVFLWLVLLAPYVLSPSYLAALVVPWLAPGARVAGAAVAGAATAFALVANAIQVRAYQSDIRRAGLTRSLLFIAWGNLLAAALAVTLVTGGFGPAGRALLAGVWPRW